MSLPEPLEALQLSEQERKQYYYDHDALPDKKYPERTDLTRWRLDVKEGRQTWRYVEEGARDLQSMVEKHHLGLDSSDEAPLLPPARTPMEATERGARYAELTQTKDGHWAGDYGGPMFLMPGLIYTHYITSTPLKPEVKIEMIRYLSNIQNRDDGGWGLHIEDRSTVFGTVTNYIALRMLGLDASDERCERARRWIKSNGGAECIPSWGKFWLCALNIYDYEGMAPVPPELWMLPYWIPFSPGRWWCHCRVVYLPMSHIFGMRAKCRETPLIRALRDEVFVTPWDKMDWPSLRQRVSSIDMYNPPSAVLSMAYKVLGVYEKMHSKSLRRKALLNTMDHIKSEDENTNWIDIGPVNKAMNMLAVWFWEGESAHFRKHVRRVDDYLWLAEDGMKMQGYNGSQLWDTAFMGQALMHAQMGTKFPSMMSKLYSFLDLTQVPNDVPNREKYFRHISKGAWPFSTRDHGWPIADCTGEGLKAVLMMHQLPYITKRIPTERLYDAVNVVMSYQNDSGGWATYERQRAGAWMEKLNGSEVFGDIMVDYCYVELSSTALQGLTSFHKDFPNHRRDEVRRAIRRGAEYIRSIQRSDGSWYGSWGVCFTYGTWFGVNGLLAAGESKSSPAIRRACEFLLSKQRDDGGWGESYMACVTKKYEDTWSQVVNTAWAVLTLMVADWPDRRPIDRAIKLLMVRQLPNGSWRQELISGVFNANCMISYSNYRQIFPVWALGLYAKKYPQVESRL